MKTLILFCSLVVLQVPLIIAQSDPNHAKEVPESVYEVLNERPELSTFMKIIDALELQNALNNPGPYTLFAPSNEAFAARFDQTRLRMLLESEDKSTLRKLILRHITNAMLTTEIIGPKVKSANVQQPTLAEEYITLGYNDGLYYAEGIAISTPNLKAGNGVVHILDGVMIKR